MRRPAVDAPKDEWRAWARHTRSGLELDVLGLGIVAGLKRWGAVGPTTRVLGFDALDDEPDVSAACTDGVFLLTRTPDVGGLTIHRVDGGLEVHRLGFRQPPADATQVDAADVDVVLVPGLAFGRDGGRLGRGGAYFDALLPRLRPGVPVVGIVPSACVADALPVESHDVAVTHLATEYGVTPIGSVPGMDADLVARAQAWMAGDPDPQTRAQIEALLAAGEEALLTEAMGGRLEFGTAGIRGEVGAGSNRMNRAVIIRTTRGLADFLIDSGRSDGVVVLGYDGRLSSRTFAEDAVGVLAAAGIAVRYFDHPVPTPLVAHAARRLEAVSAVVITASHNPPQDNGYKVYDANGAQIVPPVDTRIAAAIDAVGPAGDVPLDATAMLGSSERAVALGDEAEAAYVNEVLSARAPAERNPDLGIVYTPMHGVGRDVLSRVFRGAGYRNLRVVPEQGDPDGRFPTVAFPNPEEPGALDLATALAEEVGADLVMANDPDADRLAVVLPMSGGYRPLTGNQIGVLMADYILEHDQGGGALVANSIVSSPMLGDIAAHHGSAFTQTLTGFKWIANAAMDLERDEGLRFVFGYEEALGYTVGPTVRDKDGISAALWFADMAGASGDVLRRLEGLYRRHGVWASIQKSIVKPGASGLAEIAAAMDLLRNRRPERLASHTIEGVMDYRDGASARPRWLPASSLVVFDLGDAGRALVRPSGTEPKLKIYVDRRVEVGDGDVWETEAAAAADGRAVAEDLAEYLGLQ